MTMVDQLYEVGSQLPPRALAELLDFAEFLRHRNTPVGDNNKKGRAKMTTKNRTRQLTPNTKAYPLGKCWKTYSSSNPCVKIDLN